MHHQLWAAIAKPGNEETLVKEWGNLSGKQDRSTEDPNSKGASMRKKANILEKKRRSSKKASKLFNHQVEGSWGDHRTPLGQKKDSRGGFTSSKNTKKRPGGTSGK